MLHDPGPPSAPTATEPWRLTVPATADGVRRGLSLLRQVLSDLRLSTEEVDSVEIVLAEALNNIVEHAYADREHGKIDLSLLTRPDGLHVTLTDTGRELPGGALPAGLRPIIRPDLDSLPEGGFGWFLIRNLARDLCYSRRDGRNQLTFRIAVSALAAA